MAIHTLEWDQPPPTSCRHGVVAIGNFDAVHIGHAALLAEARRLAAQTGGSAAVLTFDPHPLQLLRPERFLPLLTTPADRATLLLQVGADEVVVMHTTPELLQLTPELFFQRVLADGLQVRGLAEGADFHFGHRRAGNIALLRTLSQHHGVQLSVVPPVSAEGAPISSSRIRDALARGEVTAAARLLGRCYRLHGRVCTGQKRGRTLGFPTANLDPLFTFAPGDGVYAVRVVRPDGVWAGAANIGANPTFGEQSRKVEVHLIGCSGDLYGEDLAVDFVARLRDTRTFAGVDDLLAQLRRDVEQARQAVVGL
jgi:riboflavin kinase/FMN adenylyltransferase